MKRVFSTRFTLDVNQMALKPPAERRPEIAGLACLEFQYLEVHSVELCVTPVVVQEIVGNVPVNSLGQTAYDRIRKSEFFKIQPAAMRLTLTAEESNRLWTDLGTHLFPGIPSTAFTTGQQGDISQLFFHLVCNSGAANATFVTADNDFLRRAPELEQRYGIAVASPNSAWEDARRRYGLSVPTASQIESVWQRQDELLRRLR
ncbi:MAG: hypothetical protein E6I48_09330 [Chloroflexi bacterium]|nr:MAG: hypothetical protein E6I48_09330 [Chloroflexota bacterium]